MNADYSHNTSTDGGGCISGFGVFMLILIFGAICASFGYLYAKPDQAAQPPLPRRARLARPLAQPA